MLNAPGSVVRRSMCARVTDTFIAGENRDKQREEEQRENRDHDVMISLGWYHLVEVSLIEVREREKTNDNEEWTKSERGQGLVPVTTGNYAKEDDTLDLHPIQNAVVTVVDWNNHDTNEFQHHGSILPVPSVATQFPSQKSVADEFTLNREQRAAFMIITSHLYGDNRSRTGTSAEVTLI